MSRRGGWRGSISAHLVCRQVLSCCSLVFHTHTHLTRSRDQCPEIQVHTRETAQRVPPTFRVVLVLVHHRPAGSTASSLRTSPAAALDRQHNARQAPTASHQAAPHSPQPPVARAPAASQAHRGPQEHLRRRPAQERDHRLADPHGESRSRLIEIRSHAPHRVAQTCTLLTANHPSSVGHLYKFATRKNPDDPASRHSLQDAVHKAALMRESALKSCIFVGVPRVRARFSPLSLERTLLIVKIFRTRRRFFRLLA